MKALNPYLNFSGNTEEAFIFYKSVFGGEFAMIQRFKDTPEASRVAAKDQDKLMHIALPIGKGNVLMATDALESMGHKLVIGNNIQLSVSADSEAEADKIFKGLSAGGKVDVPLSKQFWGAYFGMCTDKFGVQWMVSFDENQRPQ
jgi:PhnB protein